MEDFTPGWKFISIGFEGNEVSLGGLNPWKMKWHSLKLPEITVAHPSYPKERHSMSQYELRTEFKSVRFAAGEFSNGVWGVYVPE
jgi:hypothetical protein